MLVALAGHIVLGEALVVVLPVVGMEVVGMHHVGEELHTLGVVEHGRNQQVEHCVEEGSPVVEVERTVDGVVEANNRRMEVADPNLEEEDMTLICRCDVVRS
jgi:hypothetical protein